MDKIIVTGGRPLIGTINVSGAKNAALPLMTTSLLTDDKVTLTNIPHLADISTMASLLISLGTNFTLDGDHEDDSHTGKVAVLQSDNINNLEAHYDIVRKMRASVLVLGPLLARFGKARVSLPGGCAIGTRPIDLHLKAFEQMGATIKLKDGYIDAKVSGKLKGCDIQFEKVSVGATENVLMAATLAEGITNISNAAQEPEVTDLANCLAKMGAKVEGIGTANLKVTGVEKLHGAEHSIIFDRIEAGTYMIAAAITNGNITLTGINQDIMGSTIEKLQEAGIEISKKGDSYTAKRAGKDIKSVNATTQPYPGFATDMQAQLMSLMTVASGTSTIRETIFENRFMHVSELLRMGADISLEGRTAIIRGVKKLKSAEVMATDLRASVCLILAALTAEGSTLINRIYHLDRGYERIEEKLASCGAVIERVRE